MNLNDFKDTYIKKIDKINISFINSLDVAKKLKESMLYSYTAGGKRLRPLLLLATYYAFENDISKALYTAASLELIHTSSLIHDDLPAMDNDDYRRGKLTNHKIYGEATAILAGDSLLNLAYEVMLESLPADPNKQFGYLKAMKVIAHSAGISGMIGGQSADIENQGVNSDESMLSFIH